MTDRNRTAPDWEDVRYFLALARAGTLSGTARALRVNHATVSRRVAALEAALGTVLFERRPDGYGLTAAGEAALRAAERMEVSAIAFSDAVADGSASGTVRITTVRSLANSLLVEGLAAFRQRFPDIAIELVTDTRVMSLARREADVALRLGRPVDSDLVGRKLADVRYGWYANPAVAADLANGGGARLVGYDLDARGIAEADWLSKVHGDRPVPFRTNGNEAQAAAARAGFGVVLLPCYLGDTDGGLVRVDFGPPIPPRELWLLSPRDLARTARVRAVIEALADVVAARRDVIEGRRPRAA